METARNELVTVYWRPGCPYCASLRRALRREGLATREVNIWEDPAGAAVVRSIADGNETVPTVVVAGKGLVNPSAAVVLDAVRRARPPTLDAASAPELVLGASPARRPFLATVQWSLVAVLLVVSFVVEAKGYRGASWAVDAVNLVVFAALRALRRRRPLAPAPRRRPGSAT